MFGLQSDYNKRKAEIGYAGSAAYLGWRLGEVGCRVLCLALFASAFHQWVLLVLGVHWLLATVWQRLLSYTDGDSFSENKVSISCSFQVRL